MQITFKIRGAREMENLLKQLGPTVARRVASKALLAAAKPVVTEAKRLVPVLSGDLKRSLTSQSVRGGETSSRKAVNIGSRGFGWRAHFLEFGTKHAAPHPFIRPAMDTRARQALFEMGRVLAVGIETEARKLGTRRR